MKQPSVLLGWGTNNLRVVWAGKVLSALTFNLLLRELAAGRQMDGEIWMGSVSLTPKL